MASRPDHPFVPGARVAIKSYYSNEFREAFVDKVHKSGRFTLRGSPQQYRAYPERDYTTGATQYWRARQTGKGYFGDNLYLWDGAADAMLRTQLASSNRQKRFRKIQQRIERFRPDRATDAMLDQIEAALDAVDPGVKP